jgi:hypothetical protein
MKITIHTDKLSIEVEDVSQAIGAAILFKLSRVNEDSLPSDFSKVELTEEVRIAAEMWNKGASAKEVGDKLGLTANGKYSTAADPGQLYICALRKALPKLFPYRKEQVRKT